MADSQEHRHDDPSDGRDRVVVAISGSGSRAALHFAAAEATRVGRDLHVVHVVALAPVLGDVSGPEAAEAAVSDAVAAASALVGAATSVTSELFHGDVLSGLVEASHGARLVTLQRHAVGARTFDPKSTSIKIAARSAVPVACVPMAWSETAPAGIVTVGVEDPLTCRPLLRTALVAAAVRGARLRVVHTEWLPDARSANREIDQVLSGIDLAGEVDVEVLVVRGRPGDVLLEAATSSDLLVVGRHLPVLPHGSRIGAVARLMLRQAACPVLLPTPAESVTPAPRAFAGRRV